MTAITALLHTENDALRLGRALETLYACDDILIVDHASRDGTLRIARNYGAKVVDAVPGFSPQDYLLLGRGFARAGWILCLDPCESLTEKLAASLFEWKSESLHAKALAFSVFLREETAEGWVEIPAAQTRLVPHNWRSWNGKYPLHEPSALALEGELLRFTFP
jgi:glycosyltransferase involved in cell wall biosynthesis